jgi:pimeloyl-ACP methyl ester carboxylesterase
MNKRVILMEPIAPERMFKRLAAGLQDWDVTYRRMERHDVPADEMLAREADRHIAEALGEPAHVVAYSGLAAVSLFIALKCPDKLQTLTIVEPPWIGNDVWGPPEAEYRRRFDALADVESERFWEAFTKIFAPDALEVPRQPMPGGEALPKTAMTEIWNVYKATPFDRASLAAVRVPVLLAYGSLSGERARATAPAMPASDEMFICGARLAHSATASAQELRTHARARPCGGPAARLPSR